MQGLDRSVETVEGRAGGLIPSRDAGFIGFPIAYIHAVERGQDQQVRLGAGLHPLGLAGQGGRTHQDRDDRRAALPRARQDPAPPGGRILQGLGVDAA